MATYSQQIVWTAVPDGVTSDGRRLRFNIHVAPRLTVSGAPKAELSDFPAFEDWVATLGAAQLVLRIDGTPAPAQREALARPAVWAALFPPDTPVETRPVEDFRGKRILAYPLATLAERIERDYANLATAADAELPLARTLRELLPYHPEGRPKLDDLLKLLADSDSEKAVADPRTAVALLAAYHRPLDEPVEVKATKQTADDPHESVVWDSVKPVELPKPVDLAARYDFHRRLSALGQHPHLMRLAGMVVPVTVPRRGVADGPLTVQVEASWDAGGVPAEPDGRPITHCLLDGSTFVARPRGPLVRNGWLKASDARFRLVALDVDGAGLNLKNFAGALPRMGEERYDDDRFEARPPPRAGAPRLRTAGIQLGHVRRDRAIRGSFEDSFKLEDALASRAHINLFAEDVARGWRVEVAPVGVERWQSLLRFDGRYRLKASGEVVETRDEEGIIRLAAGASADGSNPDVLKATEALFAWSGWSLAAPEPGLAIMPDDVTHAEGPNESPPGLPLESSFKAHPKSLPTLRFGVSYRARLRLADIAGGGLRWSGEASGVPGIEAGPVFYGRYEPVEAPSLALATGDDDPADGESMARAALRSTDDPSRANDRARRILAPPRVGHRFAEAHGVLDRPDGRPDPALYPLLTQRDAPFATRRVTTEAYLPEGAPGPAPTVETEYAEHVAGQPTPYLYDPLCAGFALRIFGVPGIDPDKVYKLPLTGAAWDPTAATGWPDGRTVMLEASAGGSLGWDPATRVFRVPLGKAERARVRVSALVPHDGWKLFKLLERVRALPEGAGKLKKMKALLENGGHWMFTPWTTVELVHAVQRPLVVPDFESLNADRAPAAVAARLRWTSPVHAKSTLRFDVAGRWIEIDDSGPDGPTARRFEGAAFSRSFARLDHPDGRALRMLDEHVLADTRARRIFYQATATTRFREYMAPDIRADAANLTVVSTPRRAWVPSSSPPPAPIVRYLVPTFGWSASGSPGSTRRVWRTGGGLRVWLERPWFGSGANEMLAVLLPRGSADPQTGAAKDFVTQWGADPVWTGPKVTTIAPARGDFARRVDAAGPIPYGFPAPPEVPDLASEGTDLGGTMRLEDLVPQGAPAGLSVDAVPHPVAFDPDRKLWYCDLVIRPGTAYFPFVRLALARYQPRSIPGHHLSSVVMASFQQLAPDRVATVTPEPGGRVRVQVHGVTPLSGAAVPRGGVVKVQLQRLRPGRDPSLDWTDTPQGPVVRPRPVVPVRSAKTAAARRTGGRAGRMTVAMRKRVADALTAIERGDLEILVRQPDIVQWLLPPLIHEEVLRLPAAGGDRLRIVVTESEGYWTEDENGRRSTSPRSRIVYATAIEL